MKEYKDFDKVEEAGEFKKLVPGAYGCKIVDVINNEQKEYLEIHFEIVEGEFKGYFKEQFDKFGNWSGRIFRSYKESAIKFFKAFTVAIEKSNSNFKWRWKEEELINKYCVIVFGEEEYEKDNEIKIAVKAQEVRSVEAYKEGKIKIPPLKKLKQSSFDSNKTSGYTISDEDLPF